MLKLIGDILLAVCVLTSLWAVCWVLFAIENIILGVS